jgi:hypothetical protein
VLECESVSEGVDLFIKIRREHFPRRTRLGTNLEGLEKFFVVDLGYRLLRV